MDLASFGWSPDHDRQFEPFRALGLVPARIAVSFGSICTVWSESGELTAHAAGRLRLDESSEDGRLPVGLPAVGDWVALRLSANSGDAPLIHAIMPRQSAFSRKEPGNRTKQQVIAANIDTIFVMTSMNRDFNPRRLERYIAIVKESGSEPVLVLSKRDLVPPDELPQYLEEAQAVSPDTQVHAVCAMSGDGTQPLLDMIRASRTAALLGSSGVGKSTLINAWLGHDHLKTAPIRDDDRGRHTTTNRELLLLPNGGLIIDTPGMRELQLWDAAEGLAETFDDIESLSAQCRFTDCRHENEPGCAVKAAVEAGDMDEDRLDSFLKLRAELESNNQLRTEQGRRDRKQHERVACKAQKKFRKR
jgi:ribosome biogenesis GTPase / thiamine phosphate phosphatase